MSTPNDSSPAGEPAAQSSADAYYPAKFKQLELAALHARRQTLKGVPPEKHGAPPAEFPPDTVGFALSGGGIRSATFCLGVFQALARKKLLGQIDFLSTVSGGGYFGSFYGAWLNRGRAEKQPDASWLKSNVFFWHRDLRQSAPVAGHFGKVEGALADSDSFEVSWLRQNGRYLMPNGSGDALLAAAATLRNWLSIQFVLAVFLTMIFCLVSLVDRKPPEPPPVGLDWCGQLVKIPIQWSPWFWTVLPPLALGIMVGALYWVPSLSGDARNRYTRWLKNCLIAVLGLAGLALLDTAGATIWDDRHALKDAYCAWAVRAGGIGAVLLLFAGKARDFLTKLVSQKEKISVRLDWLASVAALGLAILWLTTLDTAAHALMDRWPRSLYVLTVLALLGGLQLGFLNLSSQANMYGARLTRAYLGASNPRRRNLDEQGITETIPGDVVPYETYAPEEVGGPLHLINVTVNETQDGRSKTEQMDRQGFNLAIGPVGLSAAVRHHALWMADDGKPRAAVQPVDNGSEFHCLGGTGLKSHKIEQKELGQWIGISGAAVSTALGARTSPGLSFLCGFFNVRLGWWWDSGVIPAARHASLPARVTDFLLHLPGFLFPMQSQLLNEFQARFYGSARRHWYLTDGGHFENTAAYELLRRRLPFIVICDDGGDAERQMDDFANLVRKARLDFNAEITVLPPEPVGKPSAVQPGSLTEVMDIDGKTGFSATGALLARAVFQDNGQESLLLLLKPTVTGTEPMDILNYHAAHREFPQETTADQFFDEAQWESYRKLGEITAAGIFARVEPGRPWRAAFTA